MCNPGSAAVYLNSTRGERGWLVFSFVIVQTPPYTDAAVFK